MPPVSHKSFQQGVYLLFILVSVALGFWAIAIFLQEHREFLGSGLGWGLAFLICQWLLILPHELGHGVGGKWLGYSQIRILIGSGKPFCSFGFLGFQWLINARPFGCFTLANPPNEKRLRWKELIFIAAGPAVNVGGALLSGCLLLAGGIEEPWGALLQVFFAANLFVLAENLFPLTVETPFGRRMPLASS